MILKNMSYLVTISSGGLYIVQCWKIKSEPIINLINRELLNSAQILIVTKNSSSVLAMVYRLLSVPTKNPLVKFSLRRDYAHKYNRFWFRLANIWLVQATNFDVFPLGQNILMMPMYRNLYVLQGFGGFACLHVSFIAGTKVWWIGTFDLVKEEFKMSEISNCLLSK
jgi:hypothetical protein